MIPIDFPQSNTTLGAPSTTRDVLPLRLFRNGEECISCWMPTEAERQAIAAGHPVYLRVMSGLSQPPVALEVEPPFVNPAAVSEVDAEVLRSAGIAP